MTAADSMGSLIPNRLDRKATLGSRGCAERAVEIGGTLAIDSAPGKGTRVTANVPLES